jgi:hypothetical protein
MDAKWERYAALAGVLFVVAAVVGAFVAGEPPAADDSARKVVDYFHDHDTAIRAAQYVNAAAFVPLLFWLGSLWARMRRSEGGQARLAVTAGFGAALGLISAGVSFALISAISLSVPEKTLGPAVARTLYLFSLTLLGAAAFGLLTLVLAVSILSLRTRMFPAWVAVLGFVDTVLWIVGALALVSTRGALGFLGLLAFLVWLVWILATSVLMYRGSEPAAA